MHKLALFPLEQRLEALFTLMTNAAYLMIDLGSD